MRLRHIFIPLSVAAVGVAGIYGTASSASPAKQTFTITSDMNDTGGTVTATGAITATGDDVVVSDTEDRFVFPDGSLTINHTLGRHKEHVNDNTCTATVRETGTYLITNGTGRYHGASGSGTYRYVAHLQQGCASTPTGTVTITARGPINLPNP